MYLSNQEPHTKSVNCSQFSCQQFVDHLDNRDDADLSINLVWKKGDDN